MKLTPCAFNFDDDTVFQGYTDGTFWNGFNNVWVKPEVRDAIAAHFHALSDDPDSLAALLALPVDDGLVSLAYGYATTLAHCRYFAMCDNKAAGVVAHPILGDVPTCQRCADKFGLGLKAA